MSLFVAEIDAVFSGFVANQDDTNSAELLMLTEALDIRNREVLFQEFGASATATKREMRRRLEWGLEELLPRLRAPKKVIIVAEKEAVIDLQAEGEAGADEDTGAGAGAGARAGAGALSGSKRKAGKFVWSW